MSWRDAKELAGQVTEWCVVSFIVGLMISCGLAGGFIVILVACRFVSQVLGIQLE